MTLTKYNIFVLMLLLMGFGYAAQTATYDSGGSSCSGTCDWFNAYGYQAGKMNMYFNASTLSRLANLSILVTSNVGSYSSDFFNVSCNNISSRVHNLLYEYVGYTGTYPFNIELPYDCKRADGRYLLEVSFPYPTGSPAVTRQVSNYVLTYQNNGSSFYAYNYFTGSAISIFNVTLTNSSTSITNKTTNGYINSQRIGTYTVNVSSEGYVNYNVTMLLESLKDYSFTLTPRGSLAINVYDEQTEQLLNTPVTIKIFSDAYGSNFTSSNGTFVLTGLPATMMRIEYSAENYYTRNYYMNLPTGNSSLNLFFLLNSTPVNNQPKSFSITDSSANGISGAYLLVKRPYASCNGCYRTVEIEKSDANGNNFFYAQLYDATYIFEIQYPFSSTRKITNETRLDSRSLYFKVNLDNRSLDSWYNSIVNAYGQITYAQGTNIWTYTYGGSSLSAGRLLVTYQAPYSKVTVCNSQLSYPSGSIACNQSGYANQSGLFSAYAYVTGSDGTEILIDSATWEYNNSAGVFGGTGIFLGLLIVLTMVFAGSFKPDVMIVLYAFGMVVCIMTGIIWIEISWFVGTLIVGMILISEMKL